MATFPKFRAGQTSIRADDMNYLSDRVRELNGTAARRVGNVQESGNPLGVRRVEVLSQRADFLECVAVGSETGIVRVAKPYLLRVTPFWSATPADTSNERLGIRYFYTAFDERTARKTTPPEDPTEEPTETSEDQRIIPSYERGDIIFAATRVWGGSELLSDDIPDPFGVANTIHVTAIDLNVDGRQWARV